MKSDSKLSGVLHVLLHMTERCEPQTSETLARAMRTNPVVLRRTMAGLRDRGLVRSEKGHGGGWTLGRDSAEITLRDVYEALGSPSLLGIGNRDEAPQCLVEQSVNAALGRSLKDAEALLLDRFGEITLAILHADLHRRLADRQASGGLLPDQCLSEKTMAEGSR